ncbi:MAG TPA: D-alanyl-D-alanine carboxypeptidase [Lachnospiraceae bacterium]|nr:D-alanyl-D-alanine carboxypeptidase [Lachnospiraceae bacterium]
MYSKKKPICKLIAFFAASAVFLSGCSEKSDVLFTDYELDIPADTSTSSNADWYSQDYLAENVCVIPAGRQKKKDINLPADSALLINTKTDKMLYAHDIYKRLYPASITKIVTALVALKHGNPDDIVTISYNASHITEYGAKLCGFNEGDKIKLEKLLYALIVYSGNDAGIAIAEHISGSEEAFSELMNKEMAELGAAGSHFTNPHGLHDDNHYTTAYDLYLVFNKLVSDYPDFINFISRDSVNVKFRDAIGNKKELHFTSTVKYKINTETPPEGVTVTGGKTGTTMMAGSNLILYSTGPDGSSYISVVMHASDIYSLYSQMNYLLSME